MQCHKSRLDHLNLDSLAGLTKWVFRIWFVSHDDTTTTYLLRLSVV